MTVEALLSPEPDIPQDDESQSLFHVVIGENTRAGDVMVRVAMYVNKFEVPFHFCSHAFRVARELLPNVLFERSAPPSPHLLNLGI